MSTGMICDGIAASEAIDSSGEILDVAGCDISDFEEGRGTINWEHRGSDAEGASANDTVGRILFAKKIFSAEDCSDDRQLQYWRELQLPMIYIIYRLFDGSGHPGATALAAIMRDCKKNQEKNLIGLSIEGTTLKKEKNGGRLLRSVARRVAATEKPCNKSALSNVLSDPNDPTVQKQEHEHPLFARITDSVASAISPILDSEGLEKALTAGSYNVAPSALSGSAALQVEDRSLHNRIKAAARDWDRKTPFAKFLKHKLPEVSDEFLERFSGMVQELTLKKAQKAAIKQAVSQKVIGKLKAKGVTTPTVQEDQLTIRGKPASVAPGAKIHFDEKKGVLHTPRGSFPMYIPSRDTETPDAAQKFENILSDPKVTKFHDYAMENWSKLHQRLKAGTLPPEVVMHGVLFSQMSPNTPVPNQELMYSHLVDAMNSTGKDPRSKEGLDTLRRDWLDRDQPQKWPEHSREHFQRLEGQLRLQNDSKANGRVVGDIGAFMLANNKFKNVEQYHTLHNSLVDLIGRHRGDARSGVEELMFHKDQAKKWEAMRSRALASGREDPGEYAAGPSVPGLAPKTARYTYGMLGGGNVTVPDTHFARYLFGLDKDKDINSISYIKDQLWDTKNSSVMNAIDRYYGKHHDAVKHMQSHPVWGKHFEKPEDAIFPAFWKNWVSIVPHEKARGMSAWGWNESTDHRPFWEAVGPYLRKNETDTNLASRTAKTHHDWVEKYGEMPAQLLYFRYLVPQLLEAAEKRESQQSVMKFEALGIDLQKAGVARKPAVYSIPDVVKFRGKDVKPGVASIHSADAEPNKLVALLGHNKTHFLAVPAEKVRAWDKTDLIKLPKNAKGYTVRRHPEQLEASTVISHDVHGLSEYTHHPEVKSMIHGLDFGKQTNTPAGVRAGMNDKHSFWARSPNGKRVYVKGAGTTSDKGISHDFGEAHREALYHNLAKDFYGLGQYVTPTAVVTHPTTGEHMTVVQHTGGEHFNSQFEHYDQLQELKEKGELHKIALMDMINDNMDRHLGNFTMSPNGLKLIDHGLTFSSKPYYVGGNAITAEADADEEPIHPEAVKWVSGLKPEELDQQMRRHNVPTPFIDEARRRLQALKQHLKTSPGSLADAIEAPFNLTPTEHQKILGRGAKIGFGQ